MLLGRVFIIFEHFKYHTPSKFIVFKQNNYIHFLGYPSNTSWPCATPQWGGGRFEVRL